MNKLLLATLLWSLTGCYVYVPVESATPDQGREVRVHLSPSQDIDMGTIIVRDVTRVEGIVYQATSDTLAVWSQWFHSLSGFRHYANGQIHVMDRQNVPRLEVRKLHAGRTILATGLTLAASVGVFAFTAGIGGGTTEGSGGGVRAPRIVAAIPLIGIP